MVVSVAIRNATEKLKAHGIERPQIEAQLLLAKVLKIERSQIISEDSKSLSPLQLKEFEALLERRLKFEPMAYLRGEKEFFGLSFEVNSSVLIPRPETEGLVESVLDWAKKVHRVDGLVLDVGTGSGAIAIALSKMLPESFQFVGVDISKAALEIAKKNATKNACTNIRFIEADIFDPSIELMSALKHSVAVISNPPYIPSAEIPTLMPDVVRYEPTLALDGGEDGLRYYREILGWIPERLPNLRFMAFETHLPEQAQAVGALAPQNAECNIRPPFVLLEFNSDI